jgi:hypothetical protein
MIIAAESHRTPSLPLSPFPATLTSCPQLVENPATLSLLFATLTLCVTPKSFACHSYKKLPGVGPLLPTFKLFNLPTFKHSRFYPLSFHTIPNSFTRAKMLCPLFSSKSKLFLQNTRGCIPPPRPRLSPFVFRPRFFTGHGSRITSPLSAHYSLLTGGI